MIQGYSKKLVEIYKNAQYKNFNGSLYNDTISKNGILESKDIFNCVNHERIIRTEIFPAIVGIFTERICRK